MKIKQANAGAFTNFEVLDFLRSRGAASDPMGCLGSVAPSECKVFDYLVHSAACNQTTDAINDFLKRCEKFKLAKAEKLNIINLRPSSQAELYPIIEYCDKRLAKDEAKGIDEAQELVDLVVEVLPPKPEEEVMPNEQEMDNEKTVEQN